MEKDIITAWVAGLFEGEGCFQFYLNLPRAINIVSTDRDILEKVVANFGGKIYEDTRKNAKPHWKKAYIWRIYLKDCEEFYKKIRPFLGKRRTERGDYFLQSLEDFKKKQTERQSEITNMRSEVFSLREKGYTHKKIADLLGYERSYISKILNGDFGVKVAQ